MNNNTYEYVQNDERKCQYAPDELGLKKIANAKYIKTWGFTGNRYVEALPPRISEKECIRKYFCSTEMPSKEELGHMDLEDKLSSVTVLEQLRIMFPFHMLLEREFRRALEGSYKRREERYSQNLCRRITIGNKEKESHTIMQIKEPANVVSGFSLLGLSGCGKSTAINMLVSGYPQTIIHNPGTMMQSTQIVYLIVQCPPNSGFRLLYKCVGQAIDKALGNFNCVYEKMLNPSDGARISLSTLNGILADLIEIFSIGIIVFDEIDQIDLKSTKESSIESLMLLANNTGVAIAVAGTQEAFEALFCKRRTARRMGTLIRASSYCQSIEQFQKIVDLLTAFQWLENPLEFTEEMVEELYRCTDGVIDDTVKIYERIQQHLILGKAITKESITDIAIVYYETLQRAKRKEINKLDYDQTGKPIIKTILRLNRRNASESSTGEVDSKFRKMMKAQVVAGVQEISKEYNETRIERAFEKICSKEDVTRLSFIELLERTVKYLDSHKSDLRSGTRDKNGVRKKSVTELQMELLED